MSSDTFPTFTKWLTTFELHRPRRWRIASWWCADSWASRQRMLLRMLASGTAERVEIEPLVAALAEEHRGRYRWTLGKLATRLTAGTPLADALEQTPGAVSPEATLAVRFGAQSGALPEALKSLVERDRTEESHAVARLDRMVGYFICILIIAFGIIAFAALKISPSWRAIFDDFELDTPRAFDWLTAVADWAIRYWFIILAAALVMGWALYTQRGWRYFHRVWLPRLSRSAAKLRGAEILSLLAVVQRAGRPLPGALSTLARYHYDGRIRRQLLFARNEVEQGAGPWESLSTAGLVTVSEARALEAAPTTAARTWTLDRLAVLRREQVASRVEIMLDLLHPALVLLFAAGVLLAALAMLSPLIELIDGLAG